MRLFTTIGIYNNPIPVVMPGRGYPPSRQASAEKFWKRAFQAGRHREKIWKGARVPSTILVIGGRHREKIGGCRGAFLPGIVQPPFRQDIFEEILGETFKTQQNIQNTTKRPPPQTHRTRRRLCFPLKLLQNASKHIRNAPPTVSQDPAGRPTGTSSGQRGGGWGSRRRTGSAEGQMSSRGVEESGTTFATMSDPQ